MEKKYSYIEYMCSYCGRKTTMSISSGRPMPGVCSKKGKDKPHSWRVNRKK